MDDTVETNGRKRERTTSQAKLRDGPKQRKTRVTNNLKDIQAQLDQLELLRNQKVLTREETIDLLHVFFEVLRTHQSKSDNATKSCQAIDVMEDTAILLGRPVSLVSETVNNWMDAWRAEKERGNEREKVDQKRVAQLNREDIGGNQIAIECNNDDHVMLRRFVDEELRLHGRISIQQIVEFFRSIKVIQLASKVLDKNANAAVVSATQDYLQNRGYIVDVESKSVTFSEASLAKRDTFVRTVVENMGHAPPRQLRQVFVSERFIDEFYGLPGIDGSRQGRNPVRRRCWVVMALQGKGFDSSRTSFPGIVPGSPFFVCSTMTDVSKDSSPLNGLDRSGFAHWWSDKLLPSLTDASIIIVNDEGHRKVLPPKTPEPGHMTKEEIQRKLRELKVHFDSELTTHEMRELLSTYIKDTVEPYIVTLAKAAGHKVLFSHPNYPDLQPMGYIWPDLLNKLKQQLPAPEATVEKIQSILRQELEPPGQQTHQRQIEYALSRTLTLHSNLWQGIQSEDHTGLSTSPGKN